MASLLLDTHVLVWWRIDSSRLSAAQSRALDDMEKRGNRAAISSITIWELAKMYELGRLQVSLSLDAWLEELETDPLLTVLPLTARIAAESIRLGPSFHKDPADQIIVATARCHGLRLVTNDERIHRWGKVSLLM